MNTMIDEEQARLVISCVDSAFKRGTGLLSETQDLVENQLPKGVKPLSLEHARFLFYIIPNDHGTKSSRLWAQAKDLFVNNRHIFDPQNVIKEFAGPDDPGLLEVCATPLGTRYPRETAKSWYLNSRKLIDEYQGDPEELLRSSTDAFILIKRIRDFRGFGPKTGGMFLRAAIGLGFAKVETGLEEVLVPVDIHDSRISFLTGILKMGKHEEMQGINYYDHVPRVQRMLLDTCNDLGINWLDVDRALWIIGSRGCVSRRCYLCPLQSLCSIGRTALPFNSEEP